MLREDRLNPDNQVHLFQPARYRKWNMIELANTVLYRLEL